MCMRNWERAGASIALSLFSLLSTPALASSDLLHEEIAAYNRNDFNATLAFGLDELKKSPSNATARYYLAEALVRLGRRTEAIDQYNECAILSKDAQITKYCQQALA